MSRQIKGGVYIYIHIHTMEYYLALKRILTRATTWVKTEDILLNEISQIQKDNCCMRNRE